MELRIVYGEQLSAVHQTIAALSARFPAVVASTDASTLLQRPGPGVAVALGPLALDACLATGNDPVLSLFTSEEAFRAAVAHVRSDRRRVGVSAIFAEPSVAQQFSLTRLIFRRRLTIAAVLSQNTAHLQDDLIAAAKASDLDVETLILTPGENVLRALARTSRGSVLLAVPDRAVYSAENVRLVIEATYRRGQPVIGFSAALVRAGTLASIYSSVEDVALHATSVIEHLAGGGAPTQSHPRYWRTLVNESVARSINVPIDDSVRQYTNAPR